MKIVTLIENLVYKKELYAEHGLAFYIETENKKNLFDTGQTGMFLQNAKLLGIRIEDINGLILSLGHYDHTGGLNPFSMKTAWLRFMLKNNCSLLNTVVVVVS